MTRELGSAVACSRATRLVVSPIAAFSWVTPWRTRSPTTTTPDPMAIRVCTATSATGLRLATDLRIARPTRIARSASFSWRRWIAEIGKHPVAKVLRDHAAEGLDLVGATGVERGDDVALLFRVEACRERARPHHVAEHDGQLAPFGGRRRQGRRS